MGIYRYKYVCVGINSYVWVYMGMHGYVWVYMGIYDYFGAETSVFLRKQTVSYITGVFGQFYSPNLGKKSGESSLLLLEEIRLNFLTIIWKILVYVQIFIN